MHRILSTTYAHIFKHPVGQIEIEQCDYNDDYPAKHKQPRLHRKYKNKKRKMKQEKKGCTKTENKKGKKERGKKNWMKLSFLVQNSDPL